MYFSVSIVCFFPICPLHCQF